MNSLAALLAVLIPPGAALAQHRAADALVSVNGQTITRGEALERTFRLHGVAVLNEMVDDILVRQAAKEAGITSNSAELDVRLARLQSQFPDAKAFQEKLASQGSSMEDLRARIELQLLREALVTKARGLSVTDPEVKRFFDENKKNLTSAEAVHLRMILARTEAEALEAQKKLKSGGDFAALASSISIDPSKAKGGDMGFIPKGMLQDEAAAKIYARKAGEVVGPMRLPAGYSLFKIEAFRPAKVPLLQDIQKDLRQAILVDKISKEWPAYLQGLRQKAKIQTFE